MTSDFPIFLGWCITKGAKDGDKCERYDDCAGGFCGDNGTCTSKPSCTKNSDCTRFRGDAECQNAICIIKGKAESDRKKDELLKEYLKERPKRNMFEKFLKSFGAKIAPEDIVNESKGNA